MTDNVVKLQDRKERDLLATARSLDDLQTTIFETRDMLLGQLQVLSELNDRVSALLHDPTRASEQAKGHADANHST